MFPFPIYLIKYSFLHYVPIPNIVSHSHFPEHPLKLELPLLLEPEFPLHYTMYQLINIIVSGPYLPVRP